VDLVVGNSKQKLQKLGLKGKINWEKDPQANSKRRLPRR
jgi:hypothetical protein